MLTILRRIKNLLFVLVLLGIFTYTRLNAQYEQVVIMPQKSGKWTGCVRFIDGNYEKFDGEIKTGKGSFYSFFRGYAVFDITKIPDDAEINQVELILHTEPNYDTSHEPVEVYSLSVNPVELEAGLIYQTLDQPQDVLISGDYLSQPISHNLLLNELANASLNSRLKDNWWAIGFKQTNDGNGNIRSVGGFSGYTSADSSMPICKVSYSLTYKPMLFDNRDVTYVEELRFKNAEIKISVWDHMRVDGDIITIYLNQEPVIGEYYITEKKESVNMVLRSDMPNNLLLYAHNEGLHTPNTVTVEISDGQSTQNVVLSSNLKSCEALLIRVDK